MRTLYASVFAALTAVASIGAWAQSDPKISSFVTPDLDPNEVSLSRNIGNPLTQFIGQAAFKVKITMSAASDLNRAAFIANTSVVDADGKPVAGQSAPFDNRVPGATLVVSGQNPFCVPAGSTLTCNFGDGQLVTGDTAEFIILVRSPVSGEQIKLNWSFGGDEGKGGGNGCCTQFATVYTKLVDPNTIDSAVKTHVQSYVVRGVLTSLFTGTTKSATATDPWVTIADLGNGFLVGPPTSPRNYVQGLIDEKNNPPEYASCPAINKNACWQSQVTMKDTTWPVGDPLWITVERHSSIIKNGTKLNDYAHGFLYSKTGAENTFESVSPCSSLAGGEPSAGKPCLAPKPPNAAACFEVSLGGPAFKWVCTFKAVDNGVYRR